VKGEINTVLRNLLTEKTIQLNVEAKNWEQAVRMGGQLLIDNGFVESRYVDAMVKAVKEMGPYIVIAPGIAMPHERPEEGVKQICMSLITLKEPVYFGNSANDPVKLVVAIGAVDHDTHLKAISELMEIFINDHNISKIMTSQSVKEVLDIIDGN